MEPRTKWSELKRNWSPPEELKRCRPREVQLSGAGKTLRVLSLTLFLGGMAAGIILFVKASTDLADRRQLQARGQDIVGHVVRRWETRKNPRRYWVEYVYQPASESFRGRVEVGRGGWNQLLQGASLPIRYLPASPRLHLVRGHEAVPTPLWLPYPIAGVLAFAAFLITREILRQRRLLAEGRPAPALVTRHEGARGTQHGKVVHYEFALMSGAIACSKAGPLKKPPAIGSVLCVLYEPDRARNNGLYPLSLVRPAGRHNPPRGSRGGRSR
jgi:hypothetical protein